MAETEGFFFRNPDKYLISLNVSVFEVARSCHPKQPFKASKLAPRVRSSQGLIWHLRELAH